MFLYSILTVSMTVSHLTQLPFLPQDFSALKLLMYLYCFVMFYHLFDLLVMKRGFCLHQYTLFLFYQWMHIFILHCLEKLLLLHLLLELCLNYFHPNIFLLNFFSRANYQMIMKNILKTSTSAFVEGAGWYWTYNKIIKKKLTKRNKCLKGCATISKIFCKLW